MFKKVSLTVAAAAIALTAGMANAADKVRIGVEGAYPPFSEKTPSGELIGFDIDIANALCAEMKVECELVEQDWDGMIPGLLASKYDGIIASMSITPERKKKIDFSEKYYNTPAKLASKAGMFADDKPATLAGKVIGVQSATIHADYAKATFKDSEIREYGTQEEVYLDLTAGRLDAIMADSIAIDDGFLKTDAGQGYAFFGQDHTDVQYFGEGAGVGVRQEDTELRDAFSKAIKAIRANGKYKEINDKYFDFDIYGG
ncbi:MULTISPECIES: ABC transporter substrate-binding protein [Curvivirga]|uniref:ABC transporter substrate-binding protein n=1 Tax=Curvivirga TaxID=2856846 RepID=UPI0012BD4F1C|nr:ABC transporter substrate-binding protein [Curvivirga aplysinae]MTI10968.1 ABC transporter substrate-binding protein [Curvivirga aplysinae]